MFIPRSRTIYLTSRHILANTLSFTASVFSFGCMPQPSCDKAAISLLECAYYAISFVYLHQKSLQKSRASSKRGPLLPHPATRASLFITANINQPSAEITRFTALRRIGIFIALPHDREALSRSRRSSQVSLAEGFWIWKQKKKELACLSFICVYYTRATHADDDDGTQSKRISFMSGHRPKNRRRLISSIQLTRFIVVTMGMFSTLALPSADIGKYLVNRSKNELFNYRQ